MVPHVKLDTSFRDGGRELSDTEHRVYVQLGLYVDGDGLCWPKIPTLAKGCGKSDRAVQTAIRRLCDLGLVDIVQSGGRWPKDPNIYRINRYISFGTNSSSPIDDDKGEGGCTLKEAKGETTCTPRVKLHAPLRVKSPHDRREPVEEEPYKASTTIGDDSTFFKLLETLQSLPKWTPDDGDGEWLTELLQDFDLTESQIKGFRDYYSESDKKKTKGDKLNKGIWKNRLRNWLKREGKKNQKTARPGPGHFKEHTTEELVESWGP